MIAYQTVDPEGDIWSNEALLFETEEKVNEFFNDSEKVLETLGIELEEDETIDSIDYLIDRNNEKIVRVSFECVYAGKVIILEMSKGQVIS